jgi:hypothetical protein
MNKLDCRKKNLRFLTNAQNKQNLKKYRRNTSGYRGVDWSKQKKKWRARVKVNGCEVYTKFFDDVHEAGRAAAKARQQHMPFSTT